jgi:hypothetical protein
MGADVQRRRPGARCGAELHGRVAAPSMMFEPGLLGRAGKLRVLPLRTPGSWEILWAGGTGVRDAQRTRPLREEAARPQRAAMAQHLGGRDRSALAIAIPTTSTTTSPKMPSRISLPAVLVELLPEKNDRRQPDPGEEAKRQRGEQAGGDDDEQVGEHGQQVSVAGRYAADLRSAPDVAGSHWCSSVRNDLHRRRADHVARSPASPRRDDADPPDRPAGFPVRTWGAGSGVSPGAVMCRGHRVGTRRFRRLPWRCALRAWRGRQAGRPAAAQ